MSFKPHQKTTNYYIIFLIYFIEQFSTGAYWKSDPNQNSRKVENLHFACYQTFVYLLEIKSSDKMECKLAQYISDEISEKARIVTNFSLEMNSYFEGKEYGSGLREIVIGIVCVSLKFEEFFKIGQPIYQKQANKKGGY